VSHPRAETHVYLLISNYIQIYAVFLHLCVVGGGACREEERREDDDKAREGTNLNLRLGGPITDRAAKWRGPTLDSIQSRPRLDHVLDTIYKFPAVCLPRLHTSHTPCFTSKAGKVRTILEARSNLSGAA